MAKPQDLISNLGSSFDLKKNFGSSSQCNDAEDVDCSLYLGYPADYNTAHQPVVVSSTSQVTTLSSASSAQIVNPQTTPPPRVIVNSKPVRRLCREQGEGICATCKRTFKEKEDYFPNVYKEIQLPLCNVCYHTNKAAEKKATKEAEAACFAF